MRSDRGLMVGDKVKVPSSISCSSTNEGVITAYNSSDMQFKVDFGSGSGWYDALFIKPVKIALRYTGLSISADGGLSTLEAEYSQEEAKELVTELAKFYGVIENG